MYKSSRDCYRVAIERLQEDLSLQDAFTAATIKLTSFSQGTFAGRGIALRDAENAPYHPGEKIALHFQSTTTVILPNGTPGTLADLANPRYRGHVHVAGRFDRHSHALVVLRLHL